MEAPQTKIGLNGLGRMGKMFAWWLIQAGYKKVIVNLGRDAGMSSEDVLRYILCDSTYGTFQFNLMGRFVVRDLKTSFGENWVEIEGTRFILLRENRNPKNIPWAEHGVEFVVDFTGQFNYVGREIDYEDEKCKGSIRGHLVGGTVKKVLISSPFKDEITKDARMMVMGANDAGYNPMVHHLISNASCSTTCLAHLLNVFFQYIGIKNILSVIASIPHAITGKQPGLDKLMAAGASDLCTCRSFIDSIFISTTGSADALRVIFPELKNVKFSAKSVRLNALTVSLVDAVVTFKGPALAEGDIQKIYSNLPDFARFSSQPISSIDAFGQSTATIVDGFNSSILKIEDRGNDQWTQQAILPAWFDNEWGYIWMMWNMFNMILKTI